LKEFQKSTRHFFIVDYLLQRMFAVNKISHPTGVSGFMGGLRSVFSDYFKPDTAEITASLVIEKMKQKQFDTEKLSQLFKKLPEGKWSVQTLLIHLSDFTDIFGMTDEELESIAVSDTSLSDLKWHLNIKMLQEHKKFSKEFYDLLRYNSQTLTEEQLSLLTELMSVFAFIQETSEQLLTRYENKKPSSKKLRDLVIHRIPMEFLLLRVLFIFMHMQEDKLEQYSDILREERLSVSTNKVQLPRFS